MAESEGKTAEPLEGKGIPAQAAAGRTDRVLLGLDRILLSPESFPEITGQGSPSGHTAPRSIGLVTNDGSPSALEAGGRRPARTALLEAGVPLTRLFTPEHGLSATAPDGKGVGDGRDELTGLPVTSLYGPRLAPPREILVGLDLVLFDLQDVGARFYTYLWTLFHLLEACHQAGTPLRVLDRPNPLGGLPEWVEGPLPDPDAPPTFLGRWPVPVRHSLTLGEMSLLFRAEMGLAVDLEVVTVGGWRRECLWPATGLPFPPPSPGIPSFGSALLYPGLAFLEATNVREGRGTELSFQWLGAPWIYPETAAAAVNDAGFTGLVAHPGELRRDGEVCPGVRLEVTDAGALRPVSLGLRLLALLGTLWPEAFQWSPYPTAANPRGLDHLLRLTGSAETVRLLERSPARLTPDRAAALTRAPGWWERAEPHLLYR